MNANTDIPMRDITALVAGLRDPAISKRQAAVRELGRSGNPAATELLGAALSDSHPKVRSECVQALGRLEDPEDASPYLIHALDDAEPEVRAAAIAALGRIRDHRAVNALISCLKDSDERVRIGAAEILGKLGDARAIEPLGALAADPFSDVRDAAERSIGRLIKKRNSAR
jgi:HEAT repeat protein